jgi:predicted enzyme related to lactoylglutathione lyase
MTIIDKLSMIHMAVNDADKMKAFYADKLGFKADQDVAYGGNRWVTLEFPGGGPTIVLTTYPENMKPGSQVLFFATADVEAAHKELTAQGVKLNGDVEKDDYGQRFHLEDPEGNHLVIALA